MNSKDRKKLMDFLEKEPYANLIFDQISIIDSAMEDGMWLDYQDVNENDIKKFIDKNYSSINFKRLLLVGVNNVKRDLEEDPSNFIHKSMYDRILKFARENIKQKENIVTYRVNLAGDGGFRAIFSSLELYGKKYPERYYKIDKEIFSDLFAVVELSDIVYVFNGEHLGSLVGQTITMSALKKIGLSEEEIHEVVTDEEKSLELENSENFVLAYRTERDNFLKKNKDVLYCLDEDNLLAIAASNYLYVLQRNVLDYYEFDRQRVVFREAGLTDKEIAKLEPKRLDIEGLVRLQYVFKSVEDLIDPKKVSFRNKDAIFLETGFSLEEFHKQARKLFNEYGKIYIAENRNQLFNVDILALLDRKTALSYINELDEKYRTEYMFLVYESLNNHLNIRDENNQLSFKEMIEYVKEHDPKEEHYYLIRTLINYLTGSKTISSEVLIDLQLIELDEDKNIKRSTEKGKDIIIQNDAEEKELLEKIESPEVLFSLPVSNPELYEILDDELKSIYAKKSVEEFMSNGKYKNIAQKNINVFLAKGDIGADFIRGTYTYLFLEIDDIRALIGDENLKNCFTPSELLKVVNKIREDKKKLDLSSKGKEETEFLQREYEFLKDLYKKYKFINDGKTEAEIIDLFDDLIFDDEIFGMLYCDEFISAKMLIEVNSDLALKLFRKGKFREEDKRTLALSKYVKLTPGDLIRLNEQNAISHQEVINLYMQGRISLEDISTYGEDSDIAEFISEDELVKLAKRNSIVRRKDTEEEFNKFLALYLAFKTPSREFSEKFYKGIGGKNIRQDDLINLYARGLIGIETINPDDDLLVQMIKQKVLKSEDEELLFKDTELKGRKYIRLISILRRLSNDDEKINLLASVYKDDDYISASRLDILANELSDGFNEDEDRISNHEEDEDLPKIKRTRNPYSVSEEKKIQVRSLGKIFKAFREIDPKFKHDLVSGTYIVYLADSALVEQVFRETNAGKEFTSEHATYIIKEEFFKELLKQYYSGDFKYNLYDFFVGINREGKEYFRWSVLTKARRKRPAGLDKVLHTKNWSNNLKNKLGIPVEVDDSEVDDCLSEIDNGSLPSMDEL